MLATNIHDELAFSASLKQELNLFCQIVHSFLELSLVELHMGKRVLMEILNRLEQRES